MDNKILTDSKFPFCPGCGLGPIVRSMSKALSESGYDPLDVVLVSDIGCCGIVDPLFATHTIHGLHGRSVALSSGVVLGLKDVEKKVIAIQGDGGATIGLQHILEAARRNINMTLILVNNMVYGMTGGQVSGLSSCDFKKERGIPDSSPPYDICELTFTAGAAYVTRVNSHKVLTQRLREAVTTQGFSLVEVSSLCQAYGVSKTTDLKNWTEKEVELRNENPGKQKSSRELVPLIDMDSGMGSQFRSDLTGERIGFVIAGSAGGGVQSAAKVFAKAGILSGLSVSMKGEYPITVGTGFSVAEVILSKQEINYTGLEKPDVFIILTNDGYEKVRNRIHENAMIIADSGVEDLVHPNSQRVNFKQIGGKRGAVICALAHFVVESGIMEMEALTTAISYGRHAASLLKAISNLTGIHAVQ